MKITIQTSGKNQCHSKGLVNMYRNQLIC